MMDDLYNILGVNRNATNNQIKNSFRKIIKKLHPDKNKGNTEKVIKVIKAYKILSNTEKRTQYDRDGAISEDLNLDAVAWGMLCGMLIQIVSNQNIDLDRSNLILTLKNLCLLEKKRTSFEIKQIDEKILRFENVKKRLKLKQGNDIFSMSINSEVNKLNEIKKTTTANLSRINRSLDLLKNYDYDSDKDYIQRFLINV